MEECLAVLEFYGGAITYGDYFAMPGAHRRAAVEHLVRRAKEREREARRQGARRR